MGTGTLAFRWIRYVLSCSGVLVGLNEQGNRLSINTDVLGHRRMTIRTETKLMEEVMER